jgi:hypothetical protein
LMSFIFVLTKPHAVKSSNYLDLQVNIIVNFNKTVGDQKKIFLYIINHLLCKKNERFVKIL